MKKLAIAIPLISIFIIPLKAVDNVRTAEIRCVGMGVKGITESVYFNPAALGGKERKECSIGYYNRFMMKGMGTTAFTFLYPNEIINAGFNFSTFGDKVYRDSQLSFVAAKKLAPRWSVGVSVVYRFLHIDLLEGTPAFLSTDFGITYQPVDNVTLGVSLLNLPRVEVGNVPFQYFTGYSVHAGCSWAIIPSLLLITEVGSNYETDLEGSIGLQYMPSSSFALRAGVNTEPLQPYAGAGYTFNSLLTVDAAVAYHSVLGMSAGAGLKVMF